MADFESPSFQPPKDKLHTSIVNPIVDKISEITSKGQMASGLKYSHADHNVSKNSELGLQDLAYKLYDPRSQELSERQSRPLKLEETTEEGIDRGSLNYPKTMQHRYTTGQNQKNQYDFSSENIRAMPLSTKASYNPPVEQAAYIRLENEIMDLKRTLIERLGKNDKEKEPKNEKKKTKMLTKEESEDEEDSPYRMQSKTVNAKSKENLGKGQVKSGNTLQKNVKATLKSRGGHEENLGGRTGKGDISKEDKRKTDKSLTSKGRGGLKPKEKSAVTPEEKYENLKEKYKELRGVCREYVEKTQDMEDVLKTKDLQLEDYEGEIKRRHEALIEKGEIVLDLKRQLVNRDERLDRLGKDYEVRFREQDEKNERLQQALKEKEKEYKNDREELGEEIRRLKGELDAVVQKELETGKKKDSLQEEVESLNKQVNLKSGMIEDMTRAGEEKDREILDLKSEIRRLRIEADELREKNREVEQAKKEVEDSSAREKKAFEDHLNRLADEREREMAKQREKFDALKEELKKSWSIADKAKEEKSSVSMMLEKVTLQKDDLEEEGRKVKEKLRQTEKDKEILDKEMERLRSQREESFKSVQYESERGDRIESENKKLEIVLKTFEGKLNLKEKEAYHLQEINDQLRDEMRGLIQKTEESREYIAKLERELHSLQNEHNEEIMSLERKIEKLSKEVQLVNEENRILKTSESRLNRELNAVRDEKERYRGEYRSLRETNKSLEKDLRELDDKVRDVISTKMLDISDQQRDVTSYRPTSSASKQSLRQSGSKIKVLDEIQDMIKGYRLTQKKYDPQDL